MRKLVAAVGLVGVFALADGALDRDRELPRGPRDDYVFLADVSVPDGTLMSPGQKFTKTWRLGNSGSTSWDGYRLAFRDGAQMGALAFVEIPLTAPGEMVDISVSMIAPAEPGRYRGNWIPQNAEGRPFGNGIFVVIFVEGSTYDGRTLEEWDADLDSISVEVRKHALDALGNFGPAATPAFLRAFRNDPNESIRMAALEAQWKVQPSSLETVRLFLEAVSDPSPAVSGMAVMMVYELVGPSTQLGPEVLPALVEGMRSPNSTTRAIAVQWVISLRCAAKAEEQLLRELAEYDPDPAVRGSAKDVLRTLEMGCS